MTRKATQADFHFFYRLYMHQHVNPFLLYEIMDAESFLPIFNELESKGQLYIFEDKEQAVGMFKLVPQHHRNSHIVYLGGLAIDPDHSGKGFGSMMMEEIKLLAKQNGFLRIELTVATGNEKAIELYKKAGFIHEGVLKNFTFLKSKNQFIDEAVMAFLF
jgi:L-phenylalanine/L-methionine N-acetyltransferase